MILPSMSATQRAAAIAVFEGKRGWVQAVSFKSAAHEGLGGAMNLVSPSGENGVPQIFT